ncbi:TonB family protein [Dokdonella sp.]|uniref:TonB family protein n=1 Tax=Dokdonella sp. TaxID=2291710 RepID=UPI003528A786
MILPGEAMAWVQALGLVLLHFIWQGLLVGLLFAAARSLVAREHSSLRYALGLFSLGTVALCPLLTFWILRPQGETLVSSLGVEVVVSGQAGVLASSLESTSADISQVLPALVLIWVLGVAFMIWRAVHQWRALDRIATQLAYRQADIEALLLKVADRFGGMRGIRILVSRHIDTPTLMGWIKPVILLPAAVVIGFPRQQLELILAHELGHLRRLDHLVNLGQTVVETLLFYHPVVHWISREVRHEREICCDNLVLSLTESEPSEYARTLAALEDVRQMSPQLAVAASGGMLLDRVRRIISSKGARHPSRRSHRGAWLVAAGSAGLIVSIAFMSQPGEPEGLETSARSVIAPALRSDFDQPAPFAVTPSMPDVFAAAPDLALAIEPAPDTRALALASTVAEQEQAEVAATAHRPVKLAVLQQPSAPGVSRLPIEVGDLDVADTRLAAPAVAVAPSLAAESLDSEQPTILRKVSPEFSNPSPGETHARVGFVFGIDPSGHVRDIRVVSGDRSGAFTAAARRALSQWEFDPATVQAGTGARFRQDFEFVARERVAAASQLGCTPPMGSHVCRKVRATGAPVAKTIERENEALELARAGEIVCTPPTGSLVCRPTGGLGSEYPNEQPEVATAAHLIILAGGSH